MELCQREALSWSARQTRDLPFEGVELRERPNGTGGTVLDFNGYASITGKSYEMHDFLGKYDEMIQRGAFTKTIASSCDTAFLANHGGLTMARTKAGTLRLSEDDRGLHTNADLDPSRADVSDMRSASERGDISQMSFAFRVVTQEWNEDYDQRNIQEVSLDRGDVSVVNYGASDLMDGTISLRSMSAAFPTLSDDDLLAMYNSAQAQVQERGLFLPGPDPAVEEFITKIDEAKGIAEAATPDSRNLDFYRARAFALGLRK